MKKEGDVMEGRRVNTSNMPPKRARRAAICYVTTPTRRSGRIPMAGQVVVIVVAFAFLFGCWDQPGRGVVQGGRMHY
jgi:hypothetical protein